MKTPKNSLRKIVKYLNNPDEDGGFWLPNIQRNFVWSEDQICRLFDSILREYPISILLVWKTDSEIRCRKFIDNYKSNIPLNTLYVPSNNKKKNLVLDGQQRLQSLFIGLRGSYEGKELYLDILSGAISAPDDVKFNFRFLNSSDAQFPWVRFKDLVFGTENPMKATEELFARANGGLSEAEREKIWLNIGVIFKSFHTEDGISYQELDSIEHTEIYSDDDIVEIFIRANSGGTVLGKSDLLFSLLSSSWDFADEHMENLLSDLNRHGFKFTRDFVLKLCLTLLNLGASYEVSKFRRPRVRENIENQWQDITDSLREVLDFVCGSTFIRCDKALLSYLVLIPLVYTRFHYSDSWREIERVDEYLLRVLLSGAFGGRPDQLIDECVEKINEQAGFKLEHIFESVRSQGRSLELTEERFWRIGYDSAAIHLLFNLWYKQFDYDPAFQNNLPQIDHIFPQSHLRNVKVVNPDTGRYVMKYTKGTRNQLANCMLLTRAENGSGGKSDILPEKWFADKSNDYLDMHIIPRDRELWHLDRFEDFIEKRKKLIHQKFQYLFLTS